MTNKIKKMGLLLSLGLLLTVTGVNAQQAGNVLILQINGDLWAWAGTQPQQRTNWGYNQAPVISPDGKLIAYKSTATLAVNAIKRVRGIGGGDLPANLWLMNPLTGDATRVVDQPADASFQQPGVPDNFIIRSTPTFSPDSKFLAWTEIVESQSDNPDQSGRLIVYNIANKSQRVIVSRLPPQYGVPAALQVQWGTPGIAIWSITSNSGISDSKGQPAVQQHILVFDPDGKQLSDLTVGEIYEFSWIKDGDKDYLATLGNGQGNQPVGQMQWLMLDPISGTVFGMPGVPELYSLSAPNGLSLFVASVGTTPDWRIGTADQEVAKVGAVDDVYTFSHAVTISPDGQQVAYVKQGAVLLFNTSKLSKIVSTDASGVAWGPVGWRVRRKTGS